MSSRFWTGWQIETTPPGDLFGRRETLLPKMCVNVCVVYVMLIQISLLEGSENR